MQDVKTSGFGFGRCCVLLLLAAGAALYVWENVPLMVARQTPNDVAAIGALKVIGHAQALFREADKEGDGKHDYGTLAELANAGTTGLIDSMLGSGTKQGYLFEATYGVRTDEFIWIATARPELPGTTGDRYFITNHEGVIYFTTAGPFVLDSLDCKIPAGLERANPY